MSIATTMSIKETIISQIRQVAREQNRVLAPLTDDLALSESGLDSLSFAILVAQLEDALGTDPFSASNDASFPATLGQFVRSYEDAAK
jgi:acyl carrier protein